MVLSNYEIHAIQIQTSRSSQNPILSTFFEQNIILLIPQLETDHFSSPFISEMCYLKQTHSTVIQDLQKLHSTRKRSSRILQFYTTRDPYPENYSTFRRQRDLQLIPHTEGKEIFIPIICSTHPCMLQGLPKALQDIQDIHPFQGNSTCIQDFQGSTPLQLLQPECIFYTSAGFNIKLHQVPVERLQTF